MEQKYYKTIPISQLNNEPDDEGEFKQALEGNIDAHYLLKLLPKRQREIVQLKSDGYNIIEIGKKLGISRVTVWREMKHIRKQISIIE